MAVSLKKGQGISLRKDGEFDLSRVTIGLGWDVAEQRRGGLAGIFGAKAPDYDLDAVAFLLNSNDKVESLNNQDSLVGGDVVFYNSQQHPSGAIWLTGDNRTGAGEGDDEQIIVKLNELPDRYQRILFVVAIYEGKKNKQSFGGVKNAYIRAVDARGKEMCRFDISGDASYANCCAMTFADVRREGSGWKFTAIGTAHETDRFVDVLLQYV